eukprot:gnl/MRDRNA2_/MRDRNA2_148586_c0_seq1.p1 gnl/MRDRNA2_/MRDRNA2_148586_c0~~gnl/MRDRNA2_/MRDRNA2_148586_c0_seq1.p1  ORF type:complete len:706 (+),score=106.29 gnl/MRDRNA2_/MRDRNA2_148586_c0_seq1:111-2228(+)
MGFTDQILFGRQQRPEASPAVFLFLPVNGSAESWTESQQKSISSVSQGRQKSMPSRHKSKNLFQRYLVDPEHYGGKTGEVATMAPSQSSRCNDSLFEMTFENGSPKEVLHHLHHKWTRKFNKAVGSNQVPNKGSLNKRNQVLTSRLGRRKSSDNSSTENFSFSLNREDPRHIRNQLELDEDAASCNNFKEASQPLQVNQMCEEEFGTDRLSLESTGIVSGTGGLVSLDTTLSVTLNPHERDSTKYASLGSSDSGPTYVDKFASQHSFASRTSQNSATESVAEVTNNSRRPNPRITVERAQTFSGGFPGMSSRPQSPASPRTIPASPRSPRPPGGSLPRASTVNLEDHVEAALQSSVQSALGVKKSEKTLSMSRTASRKRLDNYVDPSLREQASLMAKPGARSSGRSRRPSMAVGALGAKSRRGSMTEARPRRSSVIEEEGELGGFASTVLKRTMNAGGMSNDVRLVHTYEATRLGGKFHLDPQQVSEARCVFDAFDEDKRGTLSKDNFLQLLQALIREKFPKQRGVLQTYFPKTEMPYGHRLSFEEFLERTTPQLFDEGFLNHLASQRMQRNAMMWQVTPEDVEKLKKRFDEFDDDHSGWIDFKEFKLMVKVLLHLPMNLEIPRHKMARIWKEADADGSGQLDFDEFLVWYYTHFTDADSQRAYMDMLLGDDDDDEPPIMSPVPGMMTPMSPRSPKPKAKFTNNM